MRKCSKCKVEKEDLDFYKKTKTRLQSMCKACFNSYCIDRWIERKKRVVKECGDKCHDCSHSYPYPVYDFHHLDPTQKDLQWNKMRLVSEKRLQEEISKCVMLCANCHRIRHHVE